MYVVYDGWQYDCCGEPFKVGDNVTWISTAYEDSFDYLRGKDNKNIQIDYYYEGCAGGYGILNGKVKKINYLKRIYGKDTKKVRILNRISDVHEIIGYEVGQEFDSSSDLSEKMESSDMLVVLEDVKYKEESLDVIYPHQDTTLIFDGTKPLGLKIAQKLKKLNNNIIIASKNKKRLKIAEEELKNIGKFSKVQFVSGYIKNKRSFSKYSNNSFTIFNREPKIINIVENKRDYKKVNDFINYCVQNKKYLTFYNIILKEDHTVLEEHQISNGKKEIVNVSSINIIDYELLAEKIVDYYFGIVI